VVADSKHDTSKSSQVLVLRINVFFAFDQHHLSYGAKTVRSPAHQRLGSPVDSVLRQRDV
jgi:hypothetical protein